MKTVNTNEMRTVRGGGILKRLLCIVCLIVMFLSNLVSASAASWGVTLKSIKLNKSKVTLEVGSKEKLSVTFNPKNNLTGKNITWTTSDKKVATVSDGTIKAVAAGTATITAKSKNGKTATCKVTVTDSSLTEGIKLKVYMTHSMKQGDYKAFVVNGSNVGCAAVAQAIASSVLAKADVDPTTCWSSKKKCAIPNKYYSYTEKSWNAEAIYNELKKGRPVLVHYRYKKSGQHYVAVLGVNAGVKIKNLTYSDFICVDPYTGKTVQLNKATKFYDGSVKYIKAK